MADVALVEVFDGVSSLDFPMTNVADATRAVTLQSCKRCRRVSSSKSADFSHSRSNFSSSFCCRSRILLHSPKRHQKSKVKAGQISTLSHPDANSHKSGRLELLDMWMTNLLPLSRSAMLEPRYPPPSAPGGGGGGGPSSASASTTRLSVGGLDSLDAAVDLSRKSSSHDAAAADSDDEAPLDLKVSFRNAIPLTETDLYKCLFLPRRFGHQSVENRPSPAASWTSPGLSRGPSC